MPSLPTNPEVIVIGAGAAGVGAGLALTRLKVPHVILEAKDRVGGRAHTDTSSLGELWDHGCHWFHSADKNPLRLIAAKIGHGFLEKPRPPLNRAFLGGKWVDRSLRDEYVWRTLEKIPEAGSNGADVPAISVLDTSHPWYPVARHWVTLLYSVEPEQVSTLDAFRYEDTGINLPVRDGYGALIEKLAQPLPIRLNAAVHRVTVASQTVDVSTAAGTLRAKAAVIAVPQRMIQWERLKIVPELPPAIHQAFRDVPMGWYEKIALLFDRQVFDIDVPFIDIFDPASGMRPANFELHPFGRLIAITHIAGDEARRLEREGEDAMIDLATQNLVSAYGADLRQRIVKGTTTHWSSDPHIGGAYAASTKPGHASERALFAQTIHARLFLAGEHTSQTAMATAHGAFLSGISAAHRAAQCAGYATVPADPLWLP